MSPAFKKGVETEFPKAHLTFDKFHVMKLDNKALDQVSRMEQSEEPDLEKIRYLLTLPTTSLLESNTECGC